MAKIVNICDVCTEIFAGGDAPKGRISKERTKEYPIPIFSNGEEKEGLYGFTDAARVEKPSVTISARGTIGYTAIRTEPFVPIVRLITLVPDQNKIDIKYLYYAVQNYEFEGSGTSIPQLTVPMLKKYNFPLPSKEEQQNVASALDKINELIALRKEQLAKLDQLVKSRFIELFGTPLSNEKGWEIKSTGDVCSVTDGSHFSPVGKEDGYPMLSVRNMRNDGFHYDGCKLVSQEDYDVLVKQGCKPLKNDVLIAKDGSYFYYGFVVKKEIEQAVLSSIAILRPNLEKINPEYLCRYMLSSEIVDLVGKNYVTGAAIKRVILKGIKQIPIMLPPMAFQNQFATFVEQTDKSKLAIQQSLDKLELLQKSLMQEYFG